MVMVPIITIMIIKAMLNPTSIVISINCKLVSIKHPDTKLWINPGVIDPTVIRYIHTDLVLTCGHDTLHLFES